MIPALRISDALRGFVFHELKGPNLACARRGGPSSRGFGSVSFWKDALIQRQDRVTQVWRDGAHLGAVGSARILGGPKAWEIDYLYLCGSNPLLHLQEEIYPALLDNLVQSARERGAERVFLRCSSGSEVAGIAQRAGFFHYFNEVLLEGNAQVEGNALPGAGCGVVEVPGGNDNTDAGIVRDRFPQDTHGLFQLFSAATPQQVRVGLGFTLDQWRDSQESCRGLEWVAAHTDRLTGWAALWAYHGESHCEVMIHPDHPELLPVMVSRVLAQPGPQKWLVPDYQETTRDLLLRKGFRETAEYGISAKTVATQKFSYSMAAVEA
ncbi:MAG: hypothetical protein IIC99_02440 [Chloroflexi bacterium]|nr:hypothetical protein [Chloroflexota bacterium]